MTEQTDKLTQLTTAVAKLLDGAMAVPADADREQAAKQLAHELVKTAYEIAPASYTVDAEPLTEEQIEAIRAASQPNMAPAESFTQTLN